MSISNPGATSDPFNGRRASRARVAFVLAAAVMISAGTTGAAEPSGSTDDSAPIPAFGMPAPASKLRYDTEYPPIGYSGVAKDNAIARLQARLDKGELRLEFRPGHGYLESLLAALGIDASSQTLVYSKTSIQTALIQAATPRAIYFNEDTYVSWIPGSDEMELGSMDSSLGQVFYTFNNREGVAAHFQRGLLDCLSCHDSLSYSGGGVPRFLLMSVYVDTHGQPLTHEGSILTTDRTELRYRWGGWYVTGQHGSQLHLGNMQVHNVQELVQLESLRRGNLDNLDALFDTKPYLTDKSDIVALLVLLHQVTVQDLITEVNFDVRTALAKAGKGKLPAQTQQELKEDMDALIGAMFFVDAAGYSSRISGSSGFDKWFQTQGPRDSRGRSLRELDLTTRLFRYPLSYLVYSAAFDALPDFAKQYIYTRFAQILSGRDQTKTFANLSAADRKDLLEILTATLPAFAAVATPLR